MLKPGHLRASCRAHVAPIAAAALVACACAGIQSSVAQTTERRDSAADEGPAAHASALPAPPAGFFGSVGRWMDDYFANMRSGLKGARDQFESLGNQASGTAKDVARIPSSTLVVGRERCDSAPNGAPDCRAATAALCRGKGFLDGRTVDVQSAQKCPARAWLGGRVPGPEECRGESYVTRAACQ